MKKQMDFPEVENSCKMAQLTVEQDIQRLEKAGYLDPACKGCAEAYKCLRDHQAMPFGPSHKPSQMCQSGSRPHCTCDACF